MIDGLTRDGPVFGGLGPKLSNVLLFAHGLALRTPRQFAWPGPGRCRELQPFLGNPQPRFFVEWADRLGRVLLGLFSLRGISGGSVIGH
jgi:hypothetical protein